jgi:hypothetical protein
VGRVGCAAVCRGLREPLQGSAPPAAASWLLVEHPGPWPPFGLPGDLPPEAATALERADALGIRPQLIRRPSTRRSGPPHQAYAASARGGDVWLEGRELSDLRALAALDLHALAEGRRPGLGGTATDPLLLVCTHGRRDACCAEFGRPTAMALADRHGNAVWETTHVGGDRFAANVVCLPYGTYHGQVRPASAARVGDAALRGEVDLEHYRGRAGMPAAAQAADWYARQATRERAALGVRLVGQSGQDAAGRVSVDLEVAGRAVRLIVRARRSGCPRLTSCAPGSLSDPLEFDLERIAELAAGELAG